MRNFGDNAPRARKETNKQKQNKTKTVNWPPIPYQYNLILKKPERKIPCYFLENVSYPETACMTVSLKFSDINLSSISTSCLAKLPHFLNYHSLANYSQSSQELCLHQRSISTKDSCSQSLQTYHMPIDFIILTILPPTQACSFSFCIQELDKWHQMSAQCASLGIQITFSNSLLFPKPIRQESLIKLLLELAPSSPSLFPLRLEFILSC